MRSHRYWLVHRNNRTGEPAAATVLKAVRARKAMDLAALVADTCYLATYWVNLWVKVHAKEREEAEESKKRAAKQKQKLRSQARRALAGPPCAIHMDGDVAAA